MEILIAIIRLKKNVSLRRLSEATGISRSTLNDIENGKYMPRIDQLEAIAIALKCQITDLFKSDVL